MAAHFETVGNDRILRCSNVLEFYDFAEQSEGFASKKTSNHRTEFTGTESFEAARELAVNGWEYGRAELEQSLKDIPLSEDGQNGFSWSVTGEFFDMGTYLSGDPEHWLTPAYEPKKRIVNIVANVSASCNVKAKTLMNRGAAILSLIKVLQEKGDIVTLKAVFAANGVSGDGSKNHRIYIDMATAPFDMDAIAFLGHPSFLRRFVFAAQEVMAGQKHCDGYGTPTNIELEAMEGTTIYMPSSTSSENGYQNFETPQEAADWLMQVANKLTGEGGGE